MFRAMLMTFLIGLFAGCVTVSDSQVAGGIDRLKAADARVSLGLGYLSDGNRIKAKENLELALKYVPDYYRALYAIAYYYQQVGELSRAQEYYQNATQNNSSKYN